MPENFSAMCRSSCPPVNWHDLCRLRIWILQLATPETCPGSNMHVLLRPARLELCAATVCYGRLCSAAPALASLQAVAGDLPLGMQLRCSSDHRQEGDPACLLPEKSGLGAERPFSSPAGSSAFLSLLTNGCAHSAHACTACLPTTYLVTRGTQYVISDCTCSCQNDPVDKGALNGHCSR